MSSEKIIIPSDILVAVSPKPSALLDVLRPRMDDPMLPEIAAADYGMDRDEHLAALQHIQASGALPTPMAWGLKEVLALTRWTTPKPHEGELADGPRRGHLIRAFACAILLQAAADPLYADDDTFLGENSTLAQLLGSVMVLGRDVIQSARQLVAWRVCCRPPEDEELPFFVLGMVLLIMAQSDQEPDERLLTWWVDAVFAVEQRVRETVDVLPPASGHLWLLGLTFYDTKHEVWRALARQLLLEAPGILSPVLGCPKTPFFDVFSCPVFRPEYP